MFRPVQNVQMPAALGSNAFHRWRGGGSWKQYEVWTIGSSSPDREIEIWKKYLKKSQKQKHMKTLHEKGSSETEKGNYKDSEKTSNAINMARMTSQKIDKMLHSRIACI